LAKLRGARSLDDICVKRVILAPEEATYRKAAIHLPDELDHIQGERHVGSIARMQEGVSRHSATISWLLRDALIADGTVYASNTYINVAKRRRRKFILGEAEELEEAQLCGDTSTDLFFGHWLLESLGRELLAIDRGLPPINLANPIRIHEPGYRDILQLPAHNIDLARVRDLWLVDDRGYNKDHADRLQNLRARLRRAITGEANHLVFMDRGRTGVRRELLNADAIASTIVNRGGIVIHPERMSPHEIAATLVNAKIAVAVEGSVFAHAQLALPRGSAILSIQPPDRFNYIHKGIGDRSGLLFGFVVGKPRPGGFSLEPERLLRTLDLLEAAL
jgi:capsular polysaccharide biosynthesis protein